MSETIDDIREQKRGELKDQLDDDSETEEIAPDEPIHIEDTEHLAEVTDSYDVVLADFYADWCGPCRQLSPIVESIARETTAAVAKIDVDRHQHLAGEYGVRGVPTMVLFSDGDAVERVVGVRGEDQLAALIDNYA